MFPVVRHRDGVSQAPFYCISNLQWVSFSKNTASSIGRAITCYSVDSGAFCYYSSIRSCCKLDLAFGFDKFFLLSLSQQLVKEIDYENEDDDDDDKFRFLLYTVKLDFLPGLTDVVYIRLK
jgi:hypothetical protein